MIFSVGAALGVLLLVGLPAILLYLWWNKRNKPTGKERPTETRPNNEMEVDEVRTPLVVPHGV